MKLYSFRNSSPSQLSSSRVSVDKDFLKSFRNTLVADGICYPWNDSPQSLFCTIFAAPIVPDQIGCAEGELLLGTLTD
jgi:hypothetical protein